MNRGARRAGRGERQLSRQPRSIALRLAILLTLAILPVLTALSVFGALMVLSGDAIAEIAVTVVAVGVGAVCVSAAFARRLVADIHAVSDGLERVAQGARDVVIETSAADELGALAASANAMIAGLAREEASRDRAELARGHLLAAVSHDLRTPITALRLLAEALGDDLVTGAERQGYIDRIGTHVAALGDLVEDLFEIARLEAGEGGPVRLPGDLNQLIRESVQAMGPQAHVEGVDLSGKLAATPVPVRVDAQKIQRVLFNLIGNAIRFTPPGGEVRLATRLADGEVEVSVTDNGPGIPLDERGEVFTAFYRGGDAAARGGEGTGLGLAIARAIVEAHDGRIWLDAPRQGTRVCFTLPTTAARPIPPSSPLQVSSLE